jgi:pyridoxamine 5'-phosphate oxidase family protein
VSHFTAREAERLTEARLGRLATVGADGTPHVVPTGFTFNPELESIDISGRNMTASKKWRDLARSGRAAFVVDDLESVTPWVPWGIEIRGSAELLDADGAGMIRITPERIVAWGVDTHPYTPNARDAGR